MFKLSNFERWTDCRVLRFFERVNHTETFSYAELHKNATKLATCLKNIITTSTNASSHKNGLNIGILLSIHSPALLPAVVGIENAGCVSCFIDSTVSISNIRQRINEFCIDIVLCDLENLPKLDDDENCMKINENIQLFNRHCTLIQMKNSFRNKPIHLIANDNEDKLKTSDILFYATTSGSCGDIKPVGVTYQCFHPNVISLGKLYKVVQQDVIFCSSPQTFDPFMIDICLALNYGATLIMANNSLRCDAAMLFQVLFSSTQNEVTIMSTTPSLFMRWSSADKLNQIFLSKLRILAFGGEPFPSTSTMSKWTNWEKNSTRIFNLYGLTEMSCWASAYEITQDDIFANRKIPIGQPLDEHTSFQVNFDNELLLKSKVRKCFHSQLTSAQVIDNEFEFNLHTGDLVEANDASQLYFVGRSNSLIKFYGRKINLAEIETHARNVDGVKGAICLHDDKSNSIVLFVKVENNDESIKRQINKSIHASDIRLKIHCVPEFPLTAHGKINRIGLLNAVPNTVAKSVQLTFQEILNESLATEISFTTELSQSAEREKMPKRDIDSSFIHLGGTSLKAIQIVDELERIYTQTMPQLLPMLLDDRVSIREIVCILNRSVVSTENQFNDTNSVDQTIIRIVPRWQIDMKKCIDATPTVCKLKDDSVIVSIGSHSKLLYNVCVKSGNVISKLELPDRIESQVLQMGDFGIVGCYDGFLYCFDIHSGTIKWKFNSGAMIKCRTLSVNSTVIFGNYNESNNLWCLEADNGNMIWCQRIGNKSIYANPINLDDTNCLVCCLDGTVASINSTSSEIRWIFNAKAPVFATPSVFKNRLHDIQIILAVVDGNIYLLNSDGISIWNHQIDGNLFSSVECFPTENSRNFVFGSQNHYLYGFQIESSFSCKKMWKHKTSASIRSTPVFVQKGSNYYVIIFASDGLVYVVNCNIGQVVKKCRIDGQVFSSPVMHEQSLFVGSRNNYFYCINLTDLI